MKLSVILRDHRVFTFHPNMQEFIELRKQMIARGITEIVGTFTCILPGPPCEFCGQPVPHVDRTINEACDTLRDEAAAAGIEV